MARDWTPIGLCAALLGLLAPASAAQTPTIEITSLPAYGVPGFLHGAVSGVDFSTHHVAVYIQIEGLGWWTKPSLTQPTVPVAPDGTFVVDVATGGIDDRATIYCAALLEQSTVPPPAQGHYRVPASLAPLALDCEERYGRTIQFAGRTWAVKEAPLPVSPGQSGFSDRIEDVYVDAQGLHLRADFHAGQWWSTEVILLEHLGHGSYVFATDSELDDLDRNLTFAGFTWDAYGDELGAPNNPNREIDFEDSRWGDITDPNNAQAVVQPFYASGNLSRYAIPDLSADASLTRVFTWSPTAVRFLALQGAGAASSRSDVIHLFTYAHDPSQGHFVPSEGRERFRFNLWLNNVELGDPPPPHPYDGQPFEVVIEDFEFVPL